MDLDEDLVKTRVPIGISVILSVSAYFVTVNLIPRLKDMFIKSNLYGIDLNKRNSDKIPEAIGVVTGCIFIITLFLFIPVQFTGYFTNNSNFPHNEFAELLAALLSICCMLLLGFADDVLDLRWRHKLLLPTIASLPLLMVYYVNFNSTTIIVPKPFRIWFGQSVNLSFLYYVYMGMLAVFCTNAINILAGINGLEVGQSLVIAVSILGFNVVEMNRDYAADYIRTHQFSFYILLPYIATSLALFKYNKYPSKVFVGDTFCYLSGMTFAVVGILGHFSKTALLFFIPQIINFLYSVPQLFHMVPCPRHRIPRYNQSTDKLEISVTIFHKKDLNILGRIIMFIFRTLRIIKWEEDDKGIVTCNNLTLINFVLVCTGPLKESTLTNILLAIQVVSSLLAFTVRYPLVCLFYDV